MAQFLVIWEIDIEADSAEEAAQKAREIQLRPDSIATVFSCVNKDTGTLDEIDITPEEGEA